MTDVSFEGAVNAHRAGAKMSAFCTDSILKRLHGRVSINVGTFETFDYWDDCVDLVKKVPGNVLLCLKRKVKDGTFLKEPSNNSPTLLESFHTNNIKYVETDDVYLINEMQKLLNFIFIYGFDPCCDHPHRVHYRPSRLNQRNVLDVVGAICRKTLYDTSLDYAEKKATIAAQNRYVSKDVYFTLWRR